MGKGLVIHSTSTYGGHLEEWRISSVQLSDTTTAGGWLRTSPRLPSVDHLVLPWSVVMISSVLTYLCLCLFGGNMPLLQMSTLCPVMSLHVTTFTRPSPPLVLQVKCWG